MFDAYLIPSASGFLKPDFSDCEHLRTYLARDEYSEQDSDWQSDAEIDMLRSLVEEMAELRFHAEECYKNHAHLVKNKKKELALNWDEIEKFDPPLRLITSIAQHHLTSIERIFHALRKYLRREREMVHLSQAQQVDGKCLLWLARQPGYTPAQKAGSRQQIMAVVRKESYDTLENRVLKAFLRLALKSARRYLCDYGKLFSGKELIRSMHKMVSLFRRELQSVELKGVSRLRSLPTPNYVLMHDRHYHLIWLLYKKLLIQEQFILWVWTHRQRFCLEYIKFYLTIALRWDFKPVFDSKLWLRPKPVEGCFIEHAHFSNAYRSGSKILELYSVDSSAETGASSLMFRVGEHKRKIDFYYLPKDASINQVKNTDERCYSVVINASAHIVESDECTYVVPASKDALEDITYHLHGWAQTMLDL